MRELAATLGLTGVTFVGRIDPARIAAYYADHDVYVQSPNIDNMPTSIVESYASGLPVVSTNAGGIPVILRDGEEGLLCAVDDHRALAAHVLRLLDDPTFAQRLASAGYRACERYTWTALRPQWLRLYQDLACPAD